MIFLVYDTMYQIQLDFLKEQVSFNIISKICDGVCFNFPNMNICNTHIYSEAVYAPSQLGNNVLAKRRRCVLGAIMTHMLLGQFFKDMLPVLGWSPFFAFTTSFVAA